jgi:hypothetical protein
MKSIFCPAVLGVILGYGFMSVFPAFGNDNCVLGCAAAKSSYTAAPELLRCIVYQENYANTGRVRHASGTADDDPNGAMTAKWFCPAGDCQLKCNEVPDALVEADPMTAFYLCHKQLDVVVQICKLD